jgi:hypothetical protein
MSARRYWRTEKERDLAKQFVAESRAWQDEHLAKHGPHICTPDPADPWSVCRLIVKGEAS